MLQFCKFVNFIQGTLAELTKIISVNVDENSAHCNVKRSFSPGKQLSTKRSAVHIEMRNDVFPLGCDLSDVRPKPRETIPIGNIEFCRRIYNDICDANDLVNSIYGIPVFLVFILNATLTITSVYEILKSSDSQRELQNTLDKAEHVVMKLFLLFSHNASLFYMAVSCHFVTLEYSKLIGKIEKLMLLNPLQKNSFKQMKLFSNQVSRIGIKFTASCFFTVDMSLFSAYVAWSITYTIVLVQFN
jgi:hypothetical protein